MDASGYISVRGREEARRQGEGEGVVGWVGRGVGRCEGCVVGVDGGSGIEPLRARGSRASEAKGHERRLGAPTGRVRRLRTCLSAGASLTPSPVMA
eukprot:2102129-Pleurochrysis_carterae.AAC.1